MKEATIDLHGRLIGIARFPRLRVLAWAGDQLYASRGYQLLRASVQDPSSALTWQPVAFGNLRYHSRAWRLDRSLQPARWRRHVPGGTSAGRPRLGKEAGYRRLNDRSPHSPSRPERQDPRHRR